MGFLAWLRGQIISPVPPELEVCEFDCPLADCCQRDWEGCALRLRGGLPRANTEAGDGASSSAADAAC